MALSLRDLMDDGTHSVRKQASVTNLPNAPFALRDLITPQHEVKVPVSEKRWHNWVGQHDADRVAHWPQNRKQLIATVVRAARSQSSIRAVGSGHSHSNAPAPPVDYVELNHGEPGGAGDAGLNNVLDHEGWLKSDRELLAIQATREGSKSVGGSEGRPDPLDRNHLKRVQSGIILRRLNRHILHENGYALKNMGSFDGQTIAGAVNTSTHGTGVSLASISDSVESVEIVTAPASESDDPIVRMYRIEPSDGITDREAFEADTGNHEMELIQDDDIFHSVVVGYGCMGIVYAYTLHVRDSYWLREETKLMNWEQLTDHLSNKNGEVTSESVKSFLTKSDGDGTPCRHTQILVNIAADQVPKGMVLKDEHNEAKNNPICVVKRHYPTDKEEKPSNWELQVHPRDPHDKRWPPERPAKPLRHLGKELEVHPLEPNKDKAILLHKGLFHNLENSSPFVEDKDRSAWYVALRRLRDGGTNASEYYHPEPPEPPTPTTEVGVKLENIVDAVNAARERIRTIKNDKFDRPVFFPAPMGLRFTAASKHFLSPEKGRETAMLEVPLPIYPLSSSGAGLPNLTVTQNRELIIDPALTKLHNRLVFTGGEDSHLKFEARPHMGKHNMVGKGWLRANYDYFDANAPGFPSDAEEGWLQVYNRFNAFGTFDNKFTEQLGISNSQG